MTTAIVSAFPRKTGVGTYVDELRQVSRFDHTVFFKIRSRDSEEGFDTVVKAPLNPVGLGTYLSMYGPSVWSRAIARYDFVHLASANYANLWRYNRNMVATIHDLFPLERGVIGSQYPPYYRLYYRHEVSALSKLRGVVAISQTVAAKFHEMVPDSECSVVHQWAGEQFRPRSKQSSREALGLPLDKILILSVGTSAPRKNLSLLGKIMDRLSPEFHLVRVGDPSACFETLSHARMTSFFGVSNQLYPLFFNAADLLVMPSLDEGFGFPIAQAVNSGLPLVASDIPVFREILGSYPNLLSLRDQEAWVELVRAVADHSATRETNSDPSYTCMDGYFRAERAKGDYRAFYKKVGAPISI